MSSAASSLKAAPNRFVYGTTKAAVIGLTKAIAVDVVAKGIRCNAICPGTIDTPSLADRIAAQGDVVAARAAFLARQAMGQHLWERRKRVPISLYLASDECLEPYRPGLSRSMAAGRFSSDTRRNAFT